MSDLDTRPSDSMADQKAGEEFISPEGMSLIHLDIVERARIALPQPRGIHLAHPEVRSTEVQIGGDPNAITFKLDDSNNGPALMLITDSPDDLERVIGPENRQQAIEADGSNGYASSHVITFKSDGIDVWPLHPKPKSVSEREPIDFKDKKTILNAFSEALETTEKTDKDEERSWRRSNILRRSGAVSIDPATLAEDIDDLTKLLGQ